MLVKDARNGPGPFRTLKHKLDRYGRAKWPMIVLVLVATAAATHVSSIYYGMYLHDTGKSATIKDWAQSIAEDKFSFLGNAIEGLTARPEKIEIHTKFRDFMKLAAKRDEAMAQGLLIPTDDDWVPATIRHRGETYRVELRLKGDLSDHWKGEDGWSFKVKVKDNKSLFGLKRFALQSPATRKYMNEWLFHKLLAHQDIIHLRYDFVEVSINGRPQPIYAIEENFEKRLIEFNRHREGPIVRMTSGYSWIRKDRGLLPTFLGASLDAYQEKALLRDDTLSQEYAVARDLFESFRHEKLTVSQVFDVEKFARLFAIYDLLGHKGPPSLDDMKFYYNPVTSLIEPIGYDFNKFRPLTETERGLLGAARVLKRAGRWGVDKTLYDDVFFSDEEFFASYIRALEEISDKKFLDDFFSGIDQEFEEKLAILHKSYPWYNFKGKSILYKNQEYIKGYLSPPRGPLVYLENAGADTATLSLKVRNIHALPIEILRATLPDSTTFVPRGDAIIDAARQTTPVSVASIEFHGASRDLPSTVNANQLTVYYRIIGARQEAQVSVFPWPYTDHRFLETDLLRQKPNAHGVDFLIIDEDRKEIAFKPGQWTLRENLILPRGYQVIAGEGVTVNLSNAAKILSYSPLRLIGAEEHPVVIRSADSTGQGIVVLKADGRSVLDHVRFENLSNPSEGRWGLTGAVTFYESPVIIRHGEFVRNRSEDSLNIIRAEFEIDRTVFIESASDAFDGDFVEGKIQNSSFIDSGNDAIDVSGSTIEVQDVRVRGVGDKALSAGEKSSVAAKRIDIRDAELAITSKDLSKVEIDGLSLGSTRVGFILFQKKPEFGPASIIATNVEMTTVEVPYLLESGSSLSLDGKQIEPTRTQVKNVLYGVEFGKSSL